uniref:Pre-mRNA-splicing factor 18 n=1 Tax=Cucumis melo TaxID=3656 RepID=A0A9I9DAK3_CUCME
MDLLKQELLKKRQALATETGGKRVFKRSEIEQKQIQQLREKEKRELEAKALRQSTASATAAEAASTSSKSNPLASASTTSSSVAISSTTTTSKSLTDEQNIDNLVLPRQEVIRRLRFLKQPITLFGEDDDARLDRLKFVLKAGLFEVDSDLTEGQTNDFLRDIAELRKRQKTGILSERKRQKKEDGAGEEGDGGGPDEESADGGSSGVETDKDLKRMKANFDELCEEDKILVFFKRLLNEWNQELDEMPEAEKRTAKGKSMVATFKQCARYLHPLFKFCRKKIIFF